MGKLSTALQIGAAFGLRDGMLRLHYEFQRGSGLLSRKLRPASGWNSWALPRIAPGVSPQTLLHGRLHGSRPFFLPDVGSLRTGMKNMVGTDGEKSLLAQAESVLAGHLPFFGNLSFDCGLPPRWFQNPLTGQAVSPRQSWTEMRFASPSYGDLKFILEPSRFLFVYPLVRAYTLTADERFPEAFWQSVEDWSLHNPPMQGPLWICGQECSLRILAWSFALHAFLHSPSTTGKRVGLLISMIAAHAWRTSQTLGYARSQRSNHLITEAAGLWTAGVLYPELAASQDWQLQGARLLREAVLDHITPQGVSRQHSFNYQRMVLHVLLWCLRLSEICQSPLHPDIRSRAQAACHFLHPWVDPQTGFAPNYGSDDGSLILPLSSSAYRDFRPLLQLCAALLDRPALPPGPWDEAPLWFGLHLADSKPLPATIPATIPAPAETGYFRLGDDSSWGRSSSAVSSSAVSSSAMSSWAMIRAARYTRRPFQADQLHVDLWWRGINLARDPGTYLYNGPPPWDNGLAATAVHNTVTVDHHDQMRRVGRFLWLDWAPASGKLSAARENALPHSFTGEHHGYRRLGVTHRRSVHWLAHHGWVIVDDLAGSGQHHLCLHWLTADLPYELAQDPFRLKLHSQPSPVTWNLFSSAPAHYAVLRAGEYLWRSTAAGEPHPAAPLLGWEASTYGELRPALSLVQHTRSSLPVRLVTVLLTDERCSVQPRGSDIVILQLPPLTGKSTLNRSGEIEIYRVRLAAR